MPEPIRHEAPAAAGGATEREALSLALLSACKSTLVTREIHELLAAGADPDGPAKNGLPLRIAIGKDNASLCSLLISAGANPNLLFDQQVKNHLLEQPHFNLSTPLHYAGHLGFTGCAIALIAGGADRSIKSSNASMTAEALALASGHEWTARAIAFPLHAAAIRGQAADCLAMLDRGFDPQQKNKMRQTAQRAAELAGHSHVAVAIQSWVARDAAMSALGEASPGPR